MPSGNIPGPRIVVVGVTGSGKTTLAQKLAGMLNLQHIELDALYWQPNWINADLPVFRQRVEKALSGSTWVIDGNYSKVRDLTWTQATTLVWLDYPLSIVLWQLTIRTCQRILSREVLWNNNRETFRGAFLSRDSLFLWALQTYKRHRQEYTYLLSRPQYRHLQVIHLRKPRETEEWLENIRLSNG